MSKREADDDEGEGSVGLEAIPDTLDLHNTNPTQVAILGGRFLLIPPHRALDKTTGKIYFEFETDAEQYVDPLNTFLYIGSQILHKDGTPIPLVAAGAHNRKANILFVNGISHAWFKNCEVKINSQVVDHGDNLYMYRGDLETRLSYSRQTKEGSLNISGWDEEALPFDGIDVAHDFPNEVMDDDEPHPSIIRRYLRTTGGKVFWTIGKIHSPIFDQKKSLPDHTKIEVTLDRNPSEFVTLTHGADPEDKMARIDQIFLLARLNDVDARISEDIKAVTHSGTACKYPIRRTRTATYTHERGGTEIAIADLIPGETEMPSRIFLVFVKESAKGGGFKEDPFNYQHFRMQSLSLKVGGESIPMPEMKMNFQQGDYLLPLFSLLHSVNAFLTNEDIGIDFHNYPIRNCIYGFDLKGNGNEIGETFSRAQHKTVSLHARLTEALGYHISLIVYAEYDSEIQITADKKITKHLNG